MKKWHRAKNTHGEPLDILPKKEDYLRSLLEKEQAPFLLILDCIQDPHNLGACLRTADATGVQAIIAPKDKSVSLTETVQRVACGAALFIPFVRVTNLARTMKYLKEQGVRLVGTDEKGAKTIYETDLTGPLAFVMGSEGYGLRQLTKETCDEVTRIPMLGSVNCLNVSVSVGVCLYEAVRQREKQS
ncbi:MAG: 23S rRNA (guanosine(2251)-2'-O)-methyltransferase RlmB [Candidatus Aureabacteria bacterium]|nr:23S rRNA (guanosine(2251)-2'-O)-methyltransferase RlmB [Candidatus Auribacterota bacterium]